MAYCTVILGVLSTLDMKHFLTTVSSISVLSSGYLVSYSIIILLHLWVVVNEATLGDNVSFLVYCF